MIKTGNELSYPRMGFQCMEQEYVGGTGPKQYIIHKSNELVFTVFQLNQKSIIFDYLNMFHIFGD